MYGARRASNSGRPVVDPRGRRMRSPPIFSTPLPACREEEEGEEGEDEEEKGEDEADVVPDEQPK